jgi:hypothetical protein
MGIVMMALGKSVFVVLVLALALLANPAGAVPTIDISVEPVFHEGDAIDFSYSIVSEQDESIKYLANVNCPGSPGTLLELKELDLKANEPFAGEYVYDVAWEEVKGGRCFASVSIIEPYELEVTEPFEVITPLEFSLDVSFCKTSSCAQESKVFVLGEDVYVRYASGAKNPSVAATLTLPDGTTRQLTLPATIESEQIGTYELAITASKEGYRTVTQSEQFGVIESEADIPYTGTGSGAPGGEGERPALDYVILAAAVAAVLAVVIVVFFFHRRVKKVVTS